MVKLVVLGSSNALSSEGSNNTHMVVRGNKRTVLVDCPDNPVHRLNRVGVDYNTLTDIIVTHFHPDHVSGVPLFLMDMWLRGRQAPINIYGLQHTLDRLKKLMEMYAWDKWPNFFKVSFNILPLQENNLVLDSNEFAVYSSPVHHLIPTIGLRFEFKHSKKKVAYSCDTEPCEEVVHLSGGVDVLIHEASGELLGHSSAEQAGTIAGRAEVGRLYLIHYPSEGISKNDLIVEARKQFRGKVDLATDFLTLDF